MAASMENSFRECVDQIFQSWTVLRLAVDHGFGGIHSDEKAKWIVDAVNQWFSENSNLDPYEVEEFLGEILSNEFDTVADDGSLPQISATLCKCYSLTQQGKWPEVEGLLSRLAKPSLEKCVKDVSSKEEGSDSDSGDSCDMDTDSGHVSKNAAGDTSNVQASATSQIETAVNGETSKEKMEEDDGWTVVKKGKKR